MNDTEIILSRIAEVIDRSGFFIKDNSEFKARLKCVGLNNLYEKYENYLVPYSYRKGHLRKFNNINEEYDVFLGLDSIFSDLYKENRNGDIINLLNEITKSFNVYCVEEKLNEEFEELCRLYEILGLSIELEDDKIKVSAFKGEEVVGVSELFSVESWMEDSHKEVYDAYKSAIDSYRHGNTGACIESCRTCIVSIFSKYKETEGFAKWIRGAFNISRDNETATVDELSAALNKDLRKEELADFFKENRDGKLKKTKTIYMIYSMMSDYGTHRNEDTIESPTIEDALLCLSLTNSILFWIYLSNRR